MRAKKIVELADNMVKIFGTRNPLEIAAKLGINIEYRNYNKTVKGWFLRFNSRVNIIINQNFNSRGRKIICAHELGHALLHSDRANPVILNNFEDYSTSELEQEANLFAAALLLDQDQLETKLAEMSGYMVREILKENLNR